jgi:hypothetical protein
MQELFPPRLRDPGGLRKFGQNLWEKYRPGWAGGGIYRALGSAVSVSEEHLDLFRWRRETV